MMIRSYTPTDPLLSTQWHLYTLGRLGFSQTDGIAGLARVWADYRGGSVSVGIWDDGAQQSHWDLSANYDASKQITVDGRLNPGQPTAAGDNHGTSVAGLIAADDNGRGGVGVAPDARITGVKIFGGSDDINTAWARYLKTLDNLGSFDVTNHSYGSTPDYVLYDDAAKFEASLVNGRGGLGTINIKSAGNHNTDGNGTALDASRATVTVAAVTSNGQVASYSAYGAHVLVSAPAGSVTTDRLGTLGYNTGAAGDYTTGFGGTSASAPVVSGLVSLMLDANARLGWRDVQAILSYSASGTGSLVTGRTTYENSSWRHNGADNWNGGGLHYSNDYGFGVVNAHAAVRMAEVWTLMQDGSATSANEGQAATGMRAAGLTIASNSTQRYSFTVSGQVELEHVALTLDLKHTDMTDLRITLVSPKGTQVTVFDGSSARGSTADYGLKYTFGLEGFRGEMSSGTWTLRISDVAAGDEGTLRSVGFTGYGSTETVNDVYHYTDEVLAALARTGGSGRLVLTDADGGTDWINASAMWKNLVLDLREGATSTLGGTQFLRIAAGTVIENAVGGDGDDTITGNAADNVLMGMRGDDRLDGGAGTDTARFRGAVAEYTIVDQGGWFTVSSDKWGTDRLYGFELLRFDDRVMNLTMTAADLSAPEVTRIAPVASSVLVDPAANIVLTFDEEVTAGQGAFRIVGADGSVITLAASDARVTVSGQTVTIDPVANLAAGRSYWVEMDAGAVSDLQGNRVEAWGSADESGFETKPLGRTITGSGGADTLSGGSGVDILYGRDGADRLNGLGGNDYLIGGSGNDTLVGGAGNDVYLVAAGDRVVEGSGAGFDTVRTALTAYTLGSNVEALVYTGTAAFTGTGNALDNRILGGSAGDVLTGGAGADTLMGRLGDDRLVGGLGADVLTGGRGADVFVFASAAETGPGAMDRITDFESGADRIDLSGMDADPVLEGHQAFALVEAFDGTAGQIRQSALEGGVLVEGDANGDGVADFAVRVMGPAALLTADDFIF